MKPGNTSLLTKILRAFVLGLGLLAFVHFLDYRASEELIESFEHVEQMQDVLLRLAETHSLVKDVQRAHRGYVITGKQEFLDPYLEAKDSIPALMLALEQDLKHNPGQQQDFVRMQQLVHAKIAYADSSIQQIIEGERDVALARVEQGKRIFDTLNGVFFRMINRERQHLALVRLQAREKSDKNRRVVLLTSLVSIGLLLLALWRIVLNIKSIHTLQLELEEANQELATYNEELITTNQYLSENENKLYEVNKEMGATNANLQKLSAELSTFSYSISHDLRAPLRAISGYSSILKEEFGHQLDEEAARLVEIIRLNANRMGALIEDLLNFAKLGKKAVMKRSCDMEALIQQVLAERPEHKTATIRIDSMEPAQADPILIRQVWENLISNALKFSARQPVPEIHFTYKREENHQVFCISDNGIGFDPDYAQELFNVFKRLHTDAAFEGTGAGMAIAKRIVEGHGGTIWATATPQKGATFCFTLPLAEREQQQHGNTIG